MKNFDLKSLIIGALVAFLMVSLWRGEQAEAINLKNMGNIGNKIKSSITGLASIKKNLDNDIKRLKQDAKVLMADKNNLLAIKNQLVTLANQTKAQIDSIQKLVGVVEGHIKITQKDIQTTAGHVGQVDKIRKDLTKL